MDRGKLRRKTKVLSMYQSIISHTMVGAFCFYMGIMIGFGAQTEIQTVEDASLSTLPNPETFYSTVTRHHRLQSVEKDVNCTQQPQQQQQKQQQTFRTSPFPRSSKQMFVDFATVPRDDFNKLIDIGVPLDDTIKGAEDVLVLYTRGTGMPTGMGWKHDKRNIPAQTALENCHEVKVVLEGPSEKFKKHDRCIAILPQWESYSVHKWMRIPPKNNTSELTADLKYPLQSVQRTRQHDGSGSAAMVPNEQKINESNELLVHYLHQKQRVQRSLKMFLRGVLETSNNPSLNALVVMTCNQGQSELLSNFVCNAKAKGLDLSHVVVFATDEYTANLCKDLGVHAWYDARIYADTPQGSAERYGDPIFAKMMMAKVYCLHLAMMYGCDILFQDVDVVWHKDPLPYLTSKTFQSWDMVFQDDGSRPWRWAPYSPNSGFYFVRNTPLTRYLVETLLRSGDAIQVTRSHQHVLNELLVEFATSKGLRVKVVRKGHHNPFPGGVEFHNKPDVMKALLNGTTTNEVYAFHMSWTHSKENKKKFFQQLGEWYWNDDETSSGGCTGSACCLASPVIKCHYRDKPSIIPCVDSPRIEGDQTKNMSFW